MIMDMQYTEGLRLLMPQWLPRAIPPPVPHLCNAPHAQVQHQAPQARLLVTSRVTLGLRPSSSTPSTVVGGGGEGPAAAVVEHPVGAISTAAARRLIRDVASDLSEPEVDEVAAACGGVPLLLCLVAEALVAGRLTLEVGRGGVEGSGAGGAPHWKQSGCMERGPAGVAGRGLCHAWDKL